MYNLMKRLLLFIWIASPLFADQAKANNLQIVPSYITPLIRTPQPPLVQRKILVVLDPGHGGSNIGTQTKSKPRYQEKSLNLVTAKFVQTYLQQLGFQVMMTRNEDRFLSLNERAEFANENKAILFVSIHYNSAPSPEAEGIEVFFYQSNANKTRSHTSKKLAQSILKHTLSLTQAKSRGVKHGDYAVIRKTDMPAVLVEGGFFTNPAEMEKLKDPAYIKKLAWGIASGINDFAALTKLN